LSAAPIYHFILEEEAFERRLRARLENCQLGIVASAFFTFGAWQSLKPALQQALDSGSQITILLGRYDFVTEPRAVDGLLRMSHKHPTRLFVYFDEDFAFHFKLAVFKGRSRDAVIIGSSNLTPKGLSSIGECNLELMGNSDVVNQAVDILQRRLKVAVPAEKALSEYRRCYQRAKKFRINRSRWLARGGRTWMRTKKSKPATFVPPKGVRFPLCWVHEIENDKTLTRNIRSEHAKAKDDGYAIPCQWVHVGKPFARSVEEDATFVVCDSVGRSLGFARCTRNCEVLNDKDRLESVIFYRYRRGWKYRFRSTKRLKRVLSKLRMVDRTVVGEVVSKRLISFLRTKKGTRPTNG
jgi:HKD family nuclease